MKIRDTFSSRQQRHSLGVVEDSGQLYLSIPVSNGIVDYEEFYELTREQYETFLPHPEAAAKFAEECRTHEKDGVLIQKPGWNRGTPV